jgi:hypothetical protein
VRAKTLVIAQAGEGRYPPNLSASARLEGPRQRDGEPRLEVEARVRLALHMNESPRPQWIARMYAGSVGRDHLGVGSVSSDQILPTLAPAINVLTDHPRYHSFYTFLLDEFWRRDRPRSRPAWVAFFRPREFIFSLGTHLCDRAEHANMPAAVGSQRTRGLGQRALANYDRGFNYIKSDLGGYGLYYRSVIAELGFIYPGGRGFDLPVDVPSERGKELAAAYRSEIEQTAYYRDYFDEDEGEIPIDVIREYIRKACLCQLRRDDAADQPLVRHTFLHEGGEEAAESRRATFRLLLDLSQQTKGHALDAIRFRQLIYFGGDEAGASFTPSPALADVAHRWRLYQAREYYSFALNALWCHISDWGVTAGGDVKPLPVSELDQHIEAALDFAPVTGALSLPGEAPAPELPLTDLFAWLDLVVGVNANAPDAFDRACDILAPLNEHRLWALIAADRSSPTAVAAAVLMLAVLARRWDRESERFRPEWSIARMGDDGRLSFDGFLRALRRRSTAGAAVKDVVAWLVRDYILLQHELVALGKLPDNTFRFRREGDRLRFTAFPNPLEFNDSRFNALSTTLSELGFCDDVREPDHALTVDGEQVLVGGDLV